MRRSEQQALLSSAGAAPSRQGASDVQIWVDADACPGEIKELLFRAAQRTGTKVTLGRSPEDRRISPPRTGRRSPTNSIAG